MRVTHTEEPWFHVNRYSYQMKSRLKRDDIGERESIYYYRKKEREREDG